MSDESLIRMANQIAAFFRTQPGGPPSEKVAAHLDDFWEPGMRRRLQEIVRSGGAGLDEIVVEAVSARADAAGGNSPGRPG
ncbi:formate dehydrogenase subunit delta [uncultured Paracoccus sp.]|uniref:formate dehydrogenase subunit delta n=1 Tax=uncultured Paracoccus sp. TaxID=189685 RepID=UPI002633B7B6|nr:formate dehydrogenase subunit delta [uncultured Paracoccus sp.]